MSTGEPDDPNRVFRFVFIWLIAFAAAGVGAQQFPSIAPSNKTYGALATESLLKQAQEFSRSLVAGGYIPSEFFSNAQVELQGQSVNPSARIVADSCEYEFRNGVLWNLHRIDLRQDKGPNSLILRHLTNEVLTLTTNDAVDRAFAVLHQLGYDSDRMRQLFNVTVRRDDLMDAYPIRNGGPNFPKDLHFYGELISRKKIKISIDMLPANPELLGERMPPPVEIEFLATTGELLKAFFLPDAKAISILGIQGPQPITISGATDFTPPLFVSVVKKAAQGADFTRNEAASFVKAAWRELQDKLGTNQPKCILVCDNLNQHSVVAAELSKLAGTTPWAGVSHNFRHNLPFDAAQLDNLAKDKRGLGLLAICGAIETQFELLSGLEDKGRPSEDNLGTQEGQNAWKQYDAVTRKSLALRLDELLGRLKFSETLPDHALFLLSPKITAPAGIAQSELESLLRGKAQIFSMMGVNGYWTTGGGVSYFDGKVLTNAMVFLRVSGSLPLQQNIAWRMARKVASLTNSSANAGRFNALPDKPPRMVSGEFTRPIGQLANSFGPHPLEEITEFLGERQIQMLRKADKLEVFEIDPEKKQPTSAPMIGGYQIVREGKRLGSDAVAEFAAALLTDQNILNAADSCLPRPGVAFRAWRGRESATLIVCFECNLAWINFYDARGKRMPNAVRPNHRFFFSGRPALLKLARQALPDSPALKESRKQANPFE